uniref:Uncharacterized protein n=1 Tax=Percolomonas cosmopolitus TaxID=63605 RepID=A0A7S1PH93_9EUKA|mmetsp:Transcript_7789/g.29154  ORF Transcript_7789/g.29154 Transcript_7789/m.29154 type:complete len:344 (+) Transcript_7789:98-1129(+)
MPTQAPAPVQRSKSKTKSSSSSSKRKHSSSHQSTTSKPLKKRLKKLSTVDVMKSLIQLMHQHNYLELLSLKKLFQTLQQVQEQQEHKKSQNGQTKLSSSIPPILSTNATPIAQIYVNLDEMTNKDVAEHLKTLFKLRWDFSLAKQGYFIKYESKLRPKRLCNWFMDVLEEYMSRRLDLREKLKRIGTQEADALLQSKDEVKYLDVEAFYTQRETRNQSTSEKEQPNEYNVHTLREKGLSLTELHREMQKSKRATYDRNTTARPVTSVYDLFGGEDDLPMEMAVEMSNIKSLKGYSAQDVAQLEKQGFMTFNREEIMNETSLKNPSESGKSVSTAHTDLKDRFS